MKAVLTGALATCALLSAAPALAQVNHHHAVIVHRHRICQWRHHRKVCFYR
ncbi:MAG: hypothetical protein INR64_09950 [Caulobacteraceae bacterium]|nr:hypothetical protein [Caulobacter sp.]